MMIVNQETNGRYHTDWLNMRYPRLKVAKDLLTKDGVVFISIDEHEVENLNNTSQAGVCRGRIHQKEYLMFALAIRLGEGVEALRAKKKGEPAPEPKLIEEIRYEYERDYGSTILMNI